MRLHIIAGAAALLVAAPLSAQSAPEGMPEETVYDGDYLSVGVGAAYGPSYDGSDDYVVFPLPIVQGSFRGVDISPRPAGLALTVEPFDSGNTSLSLGVSGRMRMNRASKIKDPVVESLGELDRAIEVGPTAGLSFSGVLNPYDSITVGTDVRWDIAGAHDGMVVEPRVTYFTPLSRGMAASFSVGSEHVDDNYASYYYSVSPDDSARSGLPIYDAKGGFTKAGVNLLLGIDLDGDLTNGGLALVAIGGYSRMLGDAKDSPFTAIRGSEDQFMFGVGIGYTF